MRKLRLLAGVVAGLAMMPALGAPAAETVTSPARAILAPGGGTIVTAPLSATAPGGSITTARLSAVAPGGTITTAALSARAPGGAITTSALSVVGPRLENSTLARPILK